MKITDRLNGVVIGLLMGFRDGVPLVVFASNPNDHAIAARSLTALSAQDAGSEVALLFEDGDLRRPLIVGRIVEPARRDSPNAPGLPGSASGDAPVVISDGETVRITARERIELRVGKSAIIMERDGRITIRGQDVVSHAARSNRLRGGSVDIN